MKSHTPHPKPNWRHIKADPIALNKLFNELFFPCDFKIVDFNYLIQYFYVYMDTNICKLSIQNK